MVPVVYVIKELIQLVPFLKSWSFGYFTVIGREERAAEPPKHSSNGQFEFRVAIEGGGVKYDRPGVVLSHIPCPQVPVQESGDNFYITEHFRNLWLKKRKQKIKEF